MASPLWPCDPGQARNDGGGGGIELYRAYPDARQTLGLIAGAVSPMSDESQRRRWRRAGGMTSGQVVNVEGDGGLCTSYV